MTDEVEISEFWFADTSNFPVASLQFLRSNFCVLHRPTVGLGNPQATEKYRPRFGGCANPWRLVAGTNMTHSYPRRLTESIAVLAPRQPSALRRSSNSDRTALKLPQSAIELPCSASTTVNQCFEADGSRLAIASKSAFLSAENHERCRSRVAFQTIRHMRACRGT